MLSRKLQRYPYKNYKEFQKLRHKLHGYGNPDVARLGGSDIGVVMLRDAYRSRLELFHLMVRGTPPKHMDNLFTHKGKVLEEISTEEWWRYIDPNNPSHEQVVENINQGRKVRRFRKAPFTYVNPDYDQFAMNLDYMMVKYNNVPEGCLEVKNTSSMAVDKYEARIAPAHIYQIVTQIWTSGHRYGEVFQLIDATYPEIIPFWKEQTEGIFSQVVEATDDFLGRVKYVKKEMAKGLNEEETQILITENEPEADSGKPTEDFLKEKFKDLPENLPMDGDMETLDLAKDYLRYGLTKKEAETEQRGVKNKLLQIMLSHDAKAIDFGAMGKVSNHGRFTVSPRLLND